MFQLREGVFVDLAMILHFRVEPVPILRAHVQRVENGVRIPSSPIPVGSVLLKSTRFGFQLLSLKIFVSLSIGRVDLSIRVDVGSFGCTNPFVRLNR